MIAPTPITAEEFLELAREAEFKASWQVSEHNADRLFNRAAMLKGLARRQGIGLRMSSPMRARRDSQIRTWRSWDGEAA